MSVIDYGDFAERIARQQDRWSLLIDFQREWGWTGSANRGLTLGRESDAGEDGHGDAPVLTEAQKNFVKLHESDSGVAIPKALAEWTVLPENSYLPEPYIYLAHFQWPPARWPEQRWLDILAPQIAAGLIRPPEPARIFLRSEVFAYGWCYLERESAENDDPPVYLTITPNGSNDLDSMPGFYTPAAPSFSRWALTAAVLNVGFGLSLAMTDYNIDVDEGLYDPALTDAQDFIYIEKLTDEQRSRLIATYPLLGLDPWPCTGEAELRGGPDVLLQLALPAAGWAGYGGDLGIVGRTREAVSAVLDAIGVEQP